MNNYNLIGTQYDSLGSNKNRTDDFFKYYSGTTALVSRDLPLIVSKYNKANKILDFGCGTGLSTRCLRDKHLNVVGVDPSEAAIQIAKDNDPTGVYKKINKNEKMSFENESFEIVTASLVLMEICKDDMLSCFLEIKRILMRDGIFIAVVNSTNLYKHHDWFSLDTNYSENKNLKSGDICKIKLTDINLELTDYYWTDADYSEVAAKAGFEIVERHESFGMESDGVAWKNELTISPCVTYVFKKLA